jgi:hypothetical protein
MGTASPTSQVSLWRQATGTASLFSYSQAEVAARAYLIYLSRLPAQASDMQDWLEAERQLRDEKLARAGVAS